jgi:hypothetical protein
VFSTRRPGKKNQIPIRIIHNKCRRSPWLFLQRLMKRRPCILIVEKELVNLFRAGDRDRCRQQPFALPYISGEHGFIHMAQSKSHIIPAHLPIKQRIAINKIHNKAQFAGEEIARSLNVLNKELWGNRVKYR